MSKKTKKHDSVRSCLLAQSTTQTTRMSPCQRVVRNNDIFFSKKSANNSTNCDCISVMDIMV